MKYLALDIGNVICNVNFNNFKNSLSKLLNISDDDVEYFLNRTQKLHDMGLTQINDELRDHFHIKSSVIINELMKEWDNTVQFNNEFIECLKNKISLLKDSNEKLSIALLSNIGFEHAEIIRKKMPLNLDCSLITTFFSCEVGARKPSYLYYKTFLDMYPEYKGCLYIDDRKENVAIGNWFGLNATYFSLDETFEKNKDASDRKNIINSILNKI